MPITPYSKNEFSKKEGRTGGMTELEPKCPPSFPYTYLNSLSLFLTHRRNI
jgi:hypothetical protein